MNIDAHERITKVLSSEIADIMNDPTTEGHSTEVLADIKGAMLDVMLGVIDLRTKELMESDGEVIAHNYRNDALNTIITVVTKAQSTSSNKH